MAITIDWANKVISVPQSDLAFVSGTLYSHDTDQFWSDLKALEASVFGMPFDDTHVRTSAVTIAGVVYAPGLVITNSYTVTYEDGQYAVRLDGTNNNIFDEGIINRNQVSIIPTNSAGLQLVTGAGSAPTALEVADAVWDEASADHVVGSSFGGSVNEINTDVDALVAEQHGLTTDQATQLVELWRRLGLDSLNDVTITDTSISAGGITITIAQPDSDTTTTSRA
jgi:hypothetical protein